jgi:hypothetical protein
MWSVKLAKELPLVLDWISKTTAEAELETEILELDKGSKIKVLVVEDIPLNQLLMKTLLDDLDLSVILPKMVK